MNDSEWRVLKRLKHVGIVLALGLIFMQGHPARAAGESAPYRGPLVYMVFDKDFTVTSDNGETFPVFRWEEPNSPFFDIVSSDLPLVVEVPKRDWEYGVTSDVPQYNQIPIKDLVGSYYNAHRGIHRPGNSYYDKPITLSNGQVLNPRFYYQDPYRTNQAFRTDLAGGARPLVAAIKSMAQTKEFGPAYPLFELSTRPDLPSRTMILTYAGNHKEEWDESVSTLIQAGHMAEGATIDRIAALNNPRFTINDPTAVSQRGRAEGSLSGKKIQELTHLLDNVLSSRIDRERPENPRPNVLVYADDNIEVLYKVRDLFRARVMAVRTHDASMNVAQPPLRLILWNLGRPEYQQPMPGFMQRNPGALADDPNVIGQIMVFDSSYKQAAGGTVMQVFTSKTPVSKIVSLAYGVPETVAKQVLSKEKPCAALLRAVTPSAKGRE